MNLQEYILLTENNLKKVLQDYKFDNFKKQIYAWKLNAEFKRTYDEKYLWNRLLYITSSACFLLKNGGDKKIAYISLKECAEIYEDFGAVSEDYDRYYSLVLSALCYELAGYQANGYCIAKKLKGFEFTSINPDLDLTTDNLIINQIILILLNKIPLANYLISQNKSDIGWEIFSKAISKWYNNILILSESDYTTDINKVYHYFLAEGNVFLSQLLMLIYTRIALVFNERSIWNNLKKIDTIRVNPIWQKYIKLLAQDLYSNYSIRNLENRKSKFEFWTSQLRAFEFGFLQNEKNYVIQMPTSSGKTFIAELSILKYLINYPGKKCLYIAPFRALTSEKEKEINYYLSRLGYKVSTLSGSYEIDEFQNVILDDTDVLIATQEKTDLLLRIFPEFFDDVSFLVVDEGHIIGELDTRASLTELLMIKLRMKIPNLKTLFISAVMPPQNANEYALWLDGNEKSVLRSLLFPDSNVNEEWEPTKKLIGFFTWDGKLGKITFPNIETEDDERRVTNGVFIPSFLKEKEFGDNIPKTTNKIETSAALAFKLSFEGNTLIFCSQVRHTKSISQSLLSIIKGLALDETPPWFSDNINTESYYYACLWYGVGSDISKAIKHGVGIHYGNMQEQVRSAIENDYRKGIIKVLIATSTVAQGINFPISNLIIHSLQYGKNEYVEERNFWNIVGRAGRAGMDTEGKIIFVINTHNDMILFNRFTDKINIKEADSLFLKVLKALISLRIKEDEFTSIISTLSEPFLLDLITEEILETDCQKFVEEIMKNSLFIIQTRNQNLDTEPIKKAFISIINKFKEQATYIQLKHYSKTGFSFISNKLIDEFIEHNKEELINYVEHDDYLNILVKFFTLLEDNNIGELKSERLEKIKIPINDLFEITKKWITGEQIGQIQEYWITLNNDFEELNTFLSEALFYLYPWGITSFLTILAYKLNIELKDYPENIRNLSSYLKFGLNIPTACMSRSLGIKSRQTSILLYEQSNHLKGNEFIRWLSNLTQEDIDKYKLPEFEKENILSTALKLTVKQYQDIPNTFEFIIKGTFYITEWKETSLKIFTDDILEYKRDYENKHDPFAIKILKYESAIGYIPRDYAKIISSEIDINNTDYEIKVINVEKVDDYNKIKVKMKVLSV